MLDASGSVLPHRDPSDGKVSCTETGATLGWITVTNEGSPDETISDKCKMHSCKHTISAKRVTSLDHLLKWLENGRSANVWAHERAWVHEFGAV